MPSPALSAYLAQLSTPERAGSRLWLNARGQAEGRFFNCSLTSAFEGMRDSGTGQVAAYEASVCHVHLDDAGLSLWRLLDQAASDDESVELDRLCRMLHAINFFRQPQAQGRDLHVSVHDRLLSSVSSNHGYAFRRILDALEIPVERIVLQLPDASPAQRWLLGYVTDNYKRNGMRMALRLAAPEAAAALIATAYPAVLRIRAPQLASDEALALLLRVVRDHGVQLVVSEVDTAPVLARLEQAGAGTRGLLLMQGRALGVPAARELGTLERAAQGTPQDAPCAKPAAA